MNQGHFLRYTEEVCLSHTRKIEEWIHCIHWFFYPWEIAHNNDKFPYEKPPSEQLIMCSIGGIFEWDVSLWHFCKLVNNQQVYRNGAPKGIRTPNLLIRSQQILFMHLWYNKNNSLVKQKLPIERLAFCQAKPEFQFCQAHISRFSIYSTSDCTDLTSE